jgi:hypothetical protein
MTILSALQSAATRLVGKKQTSFFSATDGIAIELADLANESAQDILKAHEWTKLAKLFSVSGDGATQGFDLPLDFDRFPKDVSIFTTRWPGLPYSRAKDLDEWYFNQTFSFSGSPGWWLLQGGKLNVFPAPADGENVQFYYISKNIVDMNDGSTKPLFTADDDCFVLPERLITLDCIWRWKSQKGFEYSEHMQNAEIARSQEISNDKGPRILTEGSRRINAPVAYPGVLGP